MKKALFFLIGIALFSFAQAQTLIYDYRHLAIVNENGAVRLGAENTHSANLNTIAQRLDDINLNIASVVLVQDMIHRSLTEVDQALKSGIAAMQLASISSEIVSECGTILELARGNPALVLFAEDVAGQLKNRGVKLVSEVSEFVLKEGGDVLMDFEKRDALMKKIILELKVMRALCYGISRSMYWAKVNGVLRSANPYRNFMNQDLTKAREIVAGYRSLKN